MLTRRRDAALETAGLGLLTARLAPSLTASAARGLGLNLPPADALAGFRLREPSVNRATPRRPRRASLTGCAPSFLRRGSTATATPPASGRDKNSHSHRSRRGSEEAGREGSRRADEALGDSPSPGDQGKGSGCADAPGGLSEGAERGTAGGVRCHAMR